MQARPKGYIHFRVTADGNITDYHASEDLQWVDATQDLVGRHVSELVPPETSVALLRAVEECLTTRSVVDIDYSVEVAGDDRAREIRLTPISDNEVAAIVCDVTEHHAVEAGRVQLAEILEASTDYVVTTDLTGRVLYANAASRKRFGIGSPEKIITKSYSLFDFMSPESRRKFLKEGMPELLSKGCWSAEVEALDHNGARIPVWQAAITHLDDAGKPEYFSGIARDLTETKLAQAEARASEERLRALVAQGSDVILVLTAEGKITYASPAMERLLGYTERSTIGALAFDFIHPDDLHTQATAFTAAFTDHASPRGMQYRIRHADGSWRWIESYTTNHLDTPGIGGFIVNARDITARHEVNVELEQASDLLASVMGAAGQEAIIVTDATGMIVAFSRGAELLLGYSAAEVLGVLTPGAFHPPEDLAALAAKLGVTPQEMLLAGPPGDASVDHDWVFVRRDGSRFDGALNVSGRVDSNGTPCGFVILARDITERRRHQAELTQRADFDDLTGLANRAYLNIALNEAAKDKSWSKPGRIVMFIDLDRFKQVNDTLGHAAGDTVLAGVAERLNENLRNVDLAARVGGDEFVVLLGQISPAAAAEVAERIVAAIACPFDIHGAAARIGASVGLATSNADINPEALLFAADRAAYSAKHAGRGRVVAAAR